MMQTGFRLLSVLIGCLSDSHAAGHAGSTSALRARLEPLNTPTMDNPADVGTHDAGFQMDFIVCNPTQLDIRLNTRGIPLEGVLSDMFLITNPAGVRMSYRGLDAKRTAEPIESDFSNIPKGACLSQRVPIGANYQLEGDGVYTIAMKDEYESLLDYSHTPAKQVWVVNAAAHEARNLATVKQRVAEMKLMVSRTQRAQHGSRRANTVPMLSDGSCSLGELEQIFSWQADAIDKISAARSCRYDSGCNELKDTWLGPHPRNATLEKRVHDMYDIMSTKVEKSVYSCHASSCDDSTFAYVYPGDPTQTIYLCNLTFTHAHYSEKVQTLIHELSHFKTIGDTNDNAYGEQTCTQLAQTRPDLAAATADTIGYYAIYTNACYRHAPAGYRPAMPPCRTCDKSTGYTDNSCPATLAPTAAAPTSSPTQWHDGIPDDSCKWANDGVCDETQYCPCGTDKTDCGMPAQPCTTPYNQYWPTPHSPHDSGGQEPAYHCVAHTSIETAEQVEDIYWSAQASGTSIVHISDETDLFSDSHSPSDRLMETPSMFHGGIVLRRPRLAVHSTTYTFQFPVDVMLYVAYQHSALLDGYFDELRLFNDDGQVLILDDQRSIKLRDQTELYVLNKTIAAKQVVRLYTIANDPGATTLVVAVPK